MRRTGKWLLSSPSVNQSSITDHVHRNMGMQMGCVGDRSRRGGKQTTEKRLLRLCLQTWPLIGSWDGQMQPPSTHPPLTTHGPSFSTCFSLSSSHLSTCHPNQNWSNTLDSFLYIHSHIHHFTSPTSCFSFEIFFELMCSSFCSKTIALWSPSSLALSPYI